MAHASSSRPTAAAQALVTPDALAAVAAAGIAGSDFMRTAVTGTRVAFVAFLVPFMAAYRPGLLLLGDPLPVAGAIVAAVGAVFVLSIGLEEPLPAPPASGARAGVLLAGVALAVPSVGLNLAGAAVAAAICGQQLWAVRSARGTQTAVR